MNETRRFLSTAIASGLDFEVMSPNDVIQHLSMDVLAHHLPSDLKSRLLTAALGADSMSAVLVLDTLGVDALAEHAPIHLLWECVADAAQRSLGQTAPVATASAMSTSSGPTVGTMPLAPAAETATTAAKRKPNRSARASRVRAGATSRSSQMPPASTPTAIPEGDDSAFDVDTRVGADPSEGSLDGIEEGISDLDEVTSHGQKG